MNRYRAVVVEDDFSSRIMLTKLLQNVFANEINLIGDASGVRDGIELIEKEKPDLVFLDIKMQDGTGFELLNNLTFSEFRLVFTTAFDQYAVESQKYFPFNYLVKPITIEKIHPLIDKLNKDHNLYNKQMLNLFQSKFEEMGQITAKTEVSPFVVFADSKGFAKEKKSDIAYIKGVGNQSLVVFVDPNKEDRTVSKTLKDFETVLEGGAFLRIHRSFIINADNIARVNTANGGSVEMLDGEELSVSNSYSKGLRDYLNTIKV